MKAKGAVVHRAIAMGGESSKLVKLRDTYNADGLNAQVFPAKVRADGETMVVWVLIVRKAEA